MRNKEDSYYSYKIIVQFLLFLLTLYLLAFLILSPIGSLWRFLGLPEGWLYNILPLILLGPLIYLAKEIVERLTSDS